MTEGIIAIFVAVTTLVLGVADKIRQSRCSHIECCCFECDRVVEANPVSPPPRYER